MAAPSYVNASTGSTDATGDWSATCHAPAAAGNIIIFQVFQDGTTAAAVGFNQSAFSNIKDLAGNATYMDWLSAAAQPVGSPTAGYQHILIGRSTSTSAPVITGSNSTSEDLYWRFYEFSNVSTGTTLATVIENIGGTSDLYLNGVGTSNTAADSAVTTAGPDRLALNFVAVNDDNAISAFTGETGGDWTLAVAPFAESSGTDGAIGLQIATITTANTTINGGTGSIVDPDAWGVVGFALIGTTPSTIPRDAETFHDFR